MVKGLIFDLDGIIADSAIFHYYAWKEIVKQFQIDLTEEINEKVKGYPRRETLIKIFDIFNFNYSQLKEEEIEKVCDDKNELYLELISTKINRNTILPGIQDLLESAIENKLKIALASSSKNAPLILDKMGIRHYFHYIADPSSIKASKPSPDIYLLAAKGIELKPSECIGFEDAAIGVEGLKKAGIFVVGVNKNDRYVKEHSDMYFEQTYDLNLEKIMKKCKK